MKLDIYYGMVWYGMVWYGMVWYGTVRYGTVRYGTVRYGMERYGTVRYDTIRYDTLRWYGMVWYGMVWYGTVRYGTVRYGIPVVLAPSCEQFQKLVKQTLAWKFEAACYIPGTTKSNAFKRVLLITHGTSSTPWHPTSPMAPHGTKLFHCIYLSNVEITPGYYFYVSNFFFFFFFFFFLWYFKTYFKRFSWCLNTKIQNDAKI